MLVGKDEAQAQVAVFGGEIDRRESTSLAVSGTESVNKSRTHTAFGAPSAPALRLPSRWRGRRRRHRPGVGSGDLVVGEMWLVKKDGRENDDSEMVVERRARRIAWQLAPPMKIRTILS